jgi:hypothetical protein
MFILKLIEKLADPDKSNIVGKFALNLRQPGVELTSF